MCSGVNLFQMSLKSVLSKPHEELSRSILMLKLSEVQISNKNVFYTDCPRTVVAGCAATSPKQVSLHSIHTQADDTQSDGVKSNSSNNSIKEKTCEIIDCKCALELGHDENSIAPEATLNREKEIILEYEERILNETTKLKDRFNLIIQNEQIRTSCLLREAYRERQEKIAALKTQLECKNMAGLMYVMCSERNKGRLEKMRIMEEYTGYIDSLHEAILEGQCIMAEMARGYKTAAQVDAEWRDKMKKIVEEFQNFLEHYYGSRSECSRYFFDLPQLLQICAPLEPSPVQEHVVCEDGQECAGEDCVCSAGEAPDESYSCTEGDTWWGWLDAPDRPFVVFGDMADFPPQRRRELLRKLKNDSRPPPERWQQYAFNNMFLLSQCPNAAFIKNEYAKHVPRDKNHCDQSQGMQTMDSPYTTEGQRLTGGSFDFRHGPMGSLLKIVTQATAQPVINKASILAARDSLELASTTKLKEKRKSIVAEELSAFSEELDAISSLRKKRTSIAPDVESRIVEDFSGTLSSASGSSWGSGCDLCPQSIQAKKERAKSDEPDVDFVSDASRLGSLTHDSLELTPKFSPEQNDKIGYEKECPDAECQRKYVNSFTRILPPYMNTTCPFKDYEPNFDNYEPCTKEQLERLVAARVGFSASVERRDPSIGGDDFCAAATSGVYVQTSATEVQCACSPPCEEREVLTTPQPSKKRQDHIPHCQLFDDSVEFDRFRVVGENRRVDSLSKTQTPQEFTAARAESIMKILKNHPSMLSIFQTTAKC